MLTVRDMMRNQIQYLPLRHCTFTQGPLGENLKVLSVASADSDTQPAYKAGVGEDMDLGGGGTGRCGGGRRTC